MKTRMPKWEWGRANPEDFYMKLESMAEDLKRIAEALEKIAVSIDELKKK
jgi:hypothetical protein